MNIHFDELKDSDLPEVKIIYDWYIKNSTATFHTVPITIEQLKEFIYIHHPIYRSYLIFANNEIAGYCFITNYKKRQAYDRTAELTIYLSPGSRNKGIGKMALLYLEKMASEAGLRNLLGIISGDNQNSIALFEKSGYSKCAHYKNVGEKFNTLLDVVSFQKEI